MADIQHQIQISANAEQIFPLVATAKGFRQWWATDVTEAGGAVELGFFKRATVYRLRLVEATPLVKAEWICESGDEWGGTHLTFILGAQGSASSLRFIHSGWKSESDYFVSCTTTWGELMFRLKAAAEGKSRGPLFLADDMAY